MNITIDPLLTLRTPSCLSLNALLIVNELFVFKEGENTLWLWPDLSLASHLTTSSSWCQEQEGCRVGATHRSVRLLLHRNISQPLLVSANNHPAHLLFGEID